MEVYAANIEDGCARINELAKKNNMLDLQQIGNVVNGLDNLSPVYLDAFMARVKNSEVVLKELKSVLKQQKKLKESASKVCGRCVSDRSPLV